MTHEIVGPAQERLQDEHLAGEHGEFIDVDCGKCLEEARELGIIESDLPPMEFALFEYSSDAS